MKKRNLKHWVTVLLLIGFVVLGLGSAEGNESYYDNSYSSPPSSGGSSSSSESTYLVTIYHVRDGGYNATHPYTIKASSAQEAIDEGVYRFVREFPNYSITDYSAVKLY